ncbi:uncharacterized protein LOC132904095 [Amyelois transitella]|uniref:uncharacterized protein LOC132904095 n=1 Tax=Amyelois transitella TaxID=680683 RepID=UPI0029905DE9|nr:uncharacterized protein LOC132904095 [Amyelois transitella]
MGKDHADKRRPKSKKPSRRNADAADGCSDRSESRCSTPPMSPVRRREGPSKRRSLRNTTSRSARRSISRECLTSHNKRQSSPPARSRSRIRSRSRSSKNNEDNADIGNNHNLFIKNFFDALSNMASKSDSDKFPVLNVVPEFDPLNKEQTVDSWIHKVDECAQIYGWTDKHIVHYAMPKLSGIAKTWYQGLPSVLYSWGEWKIKLRESFPTRENYADLLLEMLNKRVRYGESLELYFYAKMNLLNRCEIWGKRAVDCLLAGIDDRNVRVGGQSAEFAEPEQVLKFLKSVKISYDRNNNDSAKSRDRKLNHNSEKPVSRTVISQKPKATRTCYNCNEIGHPFFRCPKPRLYCTECRLLGHLKADCSKSKQGDLVEDRTKNVLQIKNGFDTSIKYKIPIKVNNQMMYCTVDLGSEGTLIRLSEAEKLKLEWQDVSGPLLKGIANAVCQPIGLSYATIEVQGIIEQNVHILVVEDHVIPCPLLLGHTFTERPNIKIVKTDTDIIFQNDQPYLYI